MRSIESDQKKDRLLAQEIADAEKNGEFTTHASAGTYCILNDVVIVCAQ